MSSTPSGEDDNRKRESRAKSHAGWDNAVAKSGGRYKIMYDKIAEKFPELTLTEEKICVLLWDGKDDGEISEMLNYSERSVYNNCSSIRKKIGLKYPGKFHGFFISVMSASDR